MPVRHRRLGNIPTDTERTFVALADAASGMTSCSVHENVLNPGAVVPWHLHAVEEVIVCLAGEGECTFHGSPPEPYCAGSILQIPANTPHSLRNIGAGRLHQLAILGGVTPGTQWLEPKGSVARQAGREAAAGQAADAGSRSG
jgi:quercetin dioxygenase-like cupin family protein